MSSTEAGTPSGGPTRRCVKQRASLATAVWRRPAAGFVVGSILVALIGCALLWITTPSMNLLLCESHEYDSSYGQASLQLAPPAVRCDFTDDPFFFEQGVEDRGAWLLVLSPAIFIAGSWGIGLFVGRRRTRSQPQSSA